MGFTKTSFAYNDSDVWNYFYASDGSGRGSWVVGQQYYTSPNWYTRVAWSRIKLTVDSKGVKDFSFSVPYLTAGSRPLYWQLSQTATTTKPASTTNACSKSGSSALTGGQNNVNLAAGSVWYLYLYYNYSDSASTGAYGGTISVTGADNIVPADISATVNGSAVTAADVGNTVVLSYGANLTSTYKVKFTYTGTDNATKTIWLGGSSSTTAISATSISWNTGNDLATLATDVTNAGSVSGTVTVYTIYGGTQVGEKTKSLTLRFTSGITAADGWISAAYDNDHLPNNAQGVKFQGYIQGKSYCKLTLDSTKFTIPYSGTFSRWTVAIDGGTAATASGTTHTTGVFSDGTHTVTVTAYDSRGFSVSHTFTLSVMQYNAPRISGIDYFRAVYESGQYVKSDIGTYLHIKANGGCTELTYNSNVQNTVTVKVYTKKRSDPDTNYTEKATLTNSVYSNISGYDNYTYDIRIRATDLLGTTYDAYGVMQAAKWGLHFRTGTVNNNDIITGAGIGKAAETAGALEVNSDWDIMCGDELVPMVSTGLTLPAAGTYLLITSSATAANNGAWIITDAAVNLAGGSGVAVSVSGTTVTITPSSGTADAFFVRLTAK